MITQAGLQQFVEELYPELLDRVQETQDILSGLSKFLSDDPPLTRERTQKPEEDPETDQVVRDAANALAPQVFPLIPAFESAYNSVKGLSSADSAGDPIDYTATKTTIESAYIDYESDHNALVNHLRETVIVIGISRQPDMLTTFSNTSDELSDRPEQARQFADAEIPESLKTTAVSLMNILDTQIDNTITAWENV